MSEKRVPFSLEQVNALAKNHPTPFYIYDEENLRGNIRRLNDAFSWCEGFRNYFAVKACPNPEIMSILKEEGAGIDCSSMTELILSEALGFKGEEIMFTSNDTPLEEFQKAVEMGAVINLDDISHIQSLDNINYQGDFACFRYNPGNLRGGNAIIGEPVEAKYGVPDHTIVEAYQLMKDRGAKRFGLHTMLISNELNEDYFVETAEMIFELVKRISDVLNIQFEFVNLGGGIGIPYRPEEEAMDVKSIGERTQALHKQFIVDQGLKPLTVYLECGRFISGPSGYLVSKVRHVTEKYKKYVGLDACMTNLMRPALYGAYHHITVLGKEQEARNETYDVTGSLCENNDKFAINRNLPKVRPGDILAIHDAGAHGHAMGFNYNGTLRSAEFLMRTDGRFEMIRRAETARDYFATLNFPGNKWSVF
ncbi:MAG: diaminopimelate decarboxylase [SAR324 cluster bacterium]|nr:diaminopimelate decarboxylase [SAR324 cluster bacterium]